MLPHICDTVVENIIFKNKINETYSQFKKLMLTSSISNDIL